MSRPKVVVICGSTRYRDDITATGEAEALAGHIVLGPWSFERELTPAVARLLADAHHHMIRMADEVLVVNPGGYIGHSTRTEIDYATAAGKPIRYLHATLREDAVAPTASANSGAST